MSSHVLHACSVPVQIKGWTWAERPLNLEAGHKKCPYCGVDVVGPNAKVTEATKEILTVLRAGAKD